MTRATLDIADDVLAAAKERARGEGKSVGAVISELVREALTAPREPEVCCGLRPFPRRGDVIVTNELVNKLRERGAS